jgi:hypothetical protein
MPPIDQSRFKVVPCYYDLATLERSRPNAFVYSEMQSDPEIGRHPEFPREPAFWQGIEEYRSSGKWTTLYESPPDVGNHIFPCALGLWRAAPEDMRYVSPRVFVLAPAAPAQR